MKDKKIIRLIFTALTLIFWSMYWIQGIKAYLGISLFRQLDTLIKVDHIQHVYADDESELTVLRVVDIVGFI